MRSRLRKWLASVDRFLSPPPVAPDKTPLVNALADQLAAHKAREVAAADSFFDRVGEMIEAVHMAGAGPWKVSRALIDRSNALVESAVSAYESRAGIRIKEDANPMSVGAYGDIELALQNIDWRRQINLSWMEFSRWGIQQIILISRLYYLKNPICRRLVDVGAAYVFARGVEVTTNDETSNEVWKRFVERNQKTLGHVALCRAERAKDTDGNLFWIFFPDLESTGEVNVRTIDATEIADILCSPEDSDTPWFYRREWDQQIYDLQTGKPSTKHMVAWYPALGYQPTAKPDKIGDYPVMWNQPVYHRSCGSVGKWKFGCPRIFPMLDWAREARKFLEACASVRQSLSQIALTLTTKGGQQAMEGAKQQLSTTIGPSSSPWDQNPTAVAGSTFVSGPGTKLEAFKVTGSGFSPDDVRQYKLMCCMVKGVPETFLADVSTGNLATATSLDRPTETMFLELQEAWVEDLTIMATYVLGVSARAPSGKLKEAGNGVATVISMCPRRVGKDGRKVFEAFGKPETSGIQIQVNFPAIREGDIPTLVSATVEAMTLGTRGEVVGIDVKAGVEKLYDLLGIENGNELAELQYPDGTYDPERDPDEEIASPAGTSTQVAKAAERLLRAVTAMEAKRNGTAADPVHKH